MVIVKVWGGLGNQLFQYAYGRYLSEQLAVPVKYDIQVKPGIKNFTHREFGVAAFNTAVTAAQLNEIKKLKFTGNTTIERLQRKAAQKFPSLFTHFCVEPLVGPGKMPVKDQCYYDGYWHAKQHPESIKGLLQKEMVLRDALQDSVQRWMGKLEQDNAVGIHVRRTDFLHFSYLHICHLPYYEKAIQYLKQLKAGLKFYIFTDDAAWCRENFKGPEFEVVEGNEPHEDLFLLSRCPHLIISNSTFSWWAAWINHSERKTVLSPLKWPAAGGKANDLLLQGWIGLEV